MADATTTWTLSPEQVRNECDPTQLAFETAAQLPEPHEMPGQQRAYESIRFALAMTEGSYHLFVSGEPGSGRLTSTLAAVQAAAASGPAASDWCYVHHFERPGEPLAIRLAVGGGPSLAHDVDSYVTACRRELRRAFRSDGYRTQRSVVLKELQSRHARLIEQLQAEALSHGLLVQPTPEGLMMVAVKRVSRAPQTNHPASGDSARAEDGPAQASLEPVTPEEFAALSEAEQEHLRSERSLVEDAVARTMPQLEVIQDEARARLQELDRVVARQAVERLTAAILAGYADHARVQDFLRHLESDIVAHADVLGATTDEPEHPDSGDTQGKPGGDGGLISGRADEAGEGGGDRLSSLVLDEDIRERPAVAALLRRYRVNVVVAHRVDDHAPVVHELNPTYPNLLGRVEFGLHEGLPFTDHLMIKAGALHRANGGYLVLQARDLLSHPRSWDALKRALRFGVIGIESDGDESTIPASASMRPEPIPAQMKAVVIGEPEIYGLLMQLDPDFQDLFTVRADFDADVPRTPESERYYAEFAGSVARMVHLPGLAPGAVALLIEEGSRRAGDQERLSARLRGLRQLIVEAGHLASSEGPATTQRSHVARAITSAERRMSQVSDRLDDMIKRRDIMIDTDGAVVGQVNGLTIMSAAGYSFGKPARITARTAPGIAGIVNLERETMMSGPAHSKGILILSGYLAGRFAQRSPLSLAGSICFEQIYGEIEGDSASSAELYALLSSLAEVPIKQSLAVTGSVNQRGEIQPVGGVTEKVEGFFHVCKARGLTGEHGVVIPRTNVHNLMVGEEVVEALRAGQFHIHAISTIDEGIELLTGVPAGSEDADGNFLPGTVNEGVSRTLSHFAASVRGFAQAPMPGGR
jgi:lon-related putative ATP-dependent protease